MDDLEKQFFANSTNDLSAEFFAEPVKEQQETSSRGANLGGAIRNVAQATPVIGTYADEAEGLLRSMFQPGGYEKWRRNAEESAQGNIENTGYGKALNIGANIAENTILAGLTGGATLLPGVSGVQGAIEGFGEGNNWRDRAENAAFGGTIGFVVPTALNKILPTKSTQSRLLTSLAKRPLETTSPDSKVSQTIIARALQQGTTPDQIIVNQVSKGYRDNLLGNLGRAGVGEDVYRGLLMKNMAELRRPGYATYIGERIDDVLPGWGKKFMNEVESLEAKELGEDIFEKTDPRKIVKTAVNKVMKGASAEERELASKTMENAIAVQGVAKKTLPTLKAKPVSTGSGALWNFARRLGTPIRNLNNYGTMRALTLGTPNYQPGNLVGRLTNWYTPNTVRGALDALAEGYENRSLK
jgi:hypothetical protein